MSIGQRVKELRGHLTLAEFAEPLGVSTSSIHAIEIGKSKPSYDVAFKICELYECSLDWLLRGIGTKNGASPSKIEETDVITIKKDKYISLLEELNETKTELLKKEQERSNTTNTPNKESITKA